jgi:hypothetical protein
MILLVKSRFTAGRVSGTERARHRTAIGASGPYGRSALRFIPPISGSGGRRRSYLKVMSVGG